MRRTVAVAIALICAGCGGGGPQASTPVAGATPVLPPEIKDGGSDLVVSADVEPPRPGLGTTVTVKAAGYLVREQLFRGLAIGLWPDLGQDFIRALSYSVQFQPGVASDRLVRWTTGFSVTASAALLADGAVHAALDAAVAEAGKVSGLSVSVSTSGPITMFVDPSDSFWTAHPGTAGYTQINAQGSQIVSGRVVIRNLVQARRPELLSHELGHVLGLSHVRDPAALMFPGMLSRETFSSGEVICLRMMYVWREPGNRFPDIDPALAGSDRRRRSSVVTGCGG
jgi:hypothetical protein